MASVSKLPSGSFRCQIRRKGLPAECETFKSRAEAEAWGRRRERELEAVFSPRRTPSDGRLFKDLVDSYLNGPTFKNKSIGTQKRERVCVAPVLTRLGEIPVGLMSGALVQEYLDERQRDNPLRRCKADDGQIVNKPVEGKSVSGHTVRLEKAFISSVYRYAKRRNYVPINIMRDSFELPQTNQREMRITPEQQYRLFAEATELARSRRANPSLTPWLHFVFATGTRPGEAARIELSWCDFKDSVINIPRRGQKKRNPRVVLIGDELLITLKAQYKKAEVAGSPFLFWSYKNRKRGEPALNKNDARKIIPYAYYHAWRRIAKKAGIEDLTCPHVVRHEFISRLFENPSLSLSDSQIAALVGDVNVLSLEPYKHLRARSLRGEHEKHLLSVTNTIQAAGLRRAIEQNPAFAEVLEFGLEKLRSKQDKTAKDEKTLQVMEEQIRIAKGALDE